MAGLSALRQDGCTGTPVLIERFATSSVESERRLTFWNDLTNQTFTGLTIDADHPDSFSASLERIRIGDIAIAEAAAAASHVVHTRSHVRNNAEDPHFLLHFQLSGRSINRQGGKEAMLQVGDFAICDTTRPYMLGFAEPATFLVVRLPAAQLRRRFPTIDDAIGMRIPGASGQTTLFLSFLRSLQAQATQIESHENWNGVASVCSEFVAMCAGPMLALDPAVKEGRMERRVIQSAEINFMSPGFGVQQIAEETGLSPRNIQKMFAMRGTTPSAYILRLRINEAARKLELTDRSITEVAMDVGFNDLTYFTRSFRSIFGCAPREHRKRSQYLLKNRNSKIW